MVVEPLEYQPDTAAWFASLAGHPWAMLRDSVGRPGRRNDIIVAEPCATLETRGPVTAIRDREGVSRSTRDPSDLLRQWLGPPSQGPARPKGSPSSSVPSAGLATIWAGGGLVADSDPDREFEEIAVKARPMLELAEALRAEGPGRGQGVGHCRSARVT